MNISTKIVVVLIWCLVPLDTAQNTKILRKFPDEFKFGVSSAAYQIEGAWNHDGKGWHMWDFLVRTNPDAIADGTSGDVASNSYYLYHKDVQMLKELGVDTYRFSISWPRILPNGRRDYINPHGIAYYNNLINLLLENGITPFVTMYHWDLPQPLSDEGGWLNPEIVDWFNDYARVLYEHFGDRVKYWLTINEPFIHCSKAYGTGQHAPMVESPGIGYYECSKNVLLAHASAYHIYQKRFKASQKGWISIVLSMEWPIASSSSVEDTEAVQDYLGFYVNYFAEPIYSKEGNFPKRVIDRVADASYKQGLYTSRLKPFSPEEVQFIKGTADYLALNHYSSELVYRNKSLVESFKVPSFQDDCFVGTYMDPSWPTSASPWITENGPGFHKLLVYLKDTYNNPIIYITENGNSVFSYTGLNDDIKVNYYRNYLSALLDALDDGVDVRGYSAWTLMDCFEWANGYKMRFGMYEVDIEDPNRPRTPRKSAYVYKDIINKRFIDYHYDPNPYALKHHDVTMRLNKSRNS